MREATGHAWRYCAQCTHPMHATPCWHREHLAGWPSACFWHIARAPTQRDPLSTQSATCTVGRAQRRVRGAVHVVLAAVVQHRLVTPHGVCLNLRWSPPVCVGQAAVKPSGLGQPAALAGPRARARGSLQAWSACASGARRLWPTRALAHHRPAWPPQALAHAPLTCPRARTWFTAGLMRQSCSSEPSFLLEKLDTPMCLARPCVCMCACA